jgi:DNA invertase Pin-like site-specific DNA recombinase
MVAAVYARKSTSQDGVSDEQKSVARQVEHARQYAASKGWAIDNDHVYLDDGISGAEFLNRPGFLRLMNSLKPRPSFQVLVMSEESRLGREAIETAYALKQLVQAGVRVFFYLEDRERTLDSPTDKIMLSLTAFADELEREKARQRTYDAMSRKAKAGHVCGGRTFGYDNIEVSGPDGRRSHVIRKINSAEAAVIRRIFELSAKGLGLTTIAKTLNAEAALAPRSQQARPRAWAPSTVREILYRDLYRGLIVWNKTRKRNAWGQAKRETRKAGEWFSVPAPELRIVSDDLWTKVHERMDQTKAVYLRGTKGQLYGRPASGVESKYLLSGLARCATCNGSMYVKSRSHGRKRAFFYGCTSFHLRGSAVCSNSVEVPMDRSDAAVLEAIQNDVMNPDVIAATLRKALARLRPTAKAAQARRVEMERQLGEVNKQIERLTEALAVGGNVQTLVQAIKDREEHRDTLTRQIASLAGVERAGQVDWTMVEKQLRAKLEEWRQLLQRHVPQARQVLKKLLSGHIKFTPHREGGEKWYTFSAQLNLGKLLAGIACANMVASPTRTDTYGDGRRDRPSRVTRQAILKWASAAGASENALFGDQPRAAESSIECNRCVHFLSRSLLGA